MKKLLLLFLVFGLFSCSEKKNCIDTYYENSEQLKSRICYDGVTFSPEFSLDGSGSLKTNANMAYIKNGAERQYYNDGVLKIEGRWKENKKIGVWKEYYPDGQISSNIKYNKDGNPYPKYYTNKEYWPNGNLYISAKHDEYKRILRKEYYVSGELKSEMKSRWGKTIETEYYVSGELKSEKGWTRFGDTLNEKQLRQEKFRFEQLEE